MSQPIATDLDEGTLAGGEVAATCLVMPKHTPATQSFEPPCHGSSYSRPDIDLTVSIHTKCTQLIGDIAAEGASKHDVVEVAAFGIGRCGSLLDVRRYQKLFREHVPAEIATCFGTAVKYPMSKHRLLNSILSQPQSIRFSVDQSVRATCSINFGCDLDGENLMQFRGEHWICRKQVPLLHIPILIKWACIRQEPQLERDIRKRQRNGQRSERDRDASALAVLIIRVVPWALALVRVAANDADAPNSTTCVVNKHIAVTNVNQLAPTGNCTTVCVRKRGPHYGKRIHTTLKTPTLIHPPRCSHGRNHTHYRTAAQKVPRA